MNYTRNEKILKLFGENLKRIRNERKISIRKLADIADVDFSQVHKIEKGQANPTLTMILALAGALEINPSLLLDFE